MLLRIYHNDAMRSRPLHFICTKRVDESNEFPDIGIWNTILPRCHDVGAILLAIGDRVMYFLRIQI